MPRLSDHEQRRAEIVAALLRIAASRGLHAASMRTVAAEAGVTVSTVQYYFHSKERLLFAGLQHLTELLARRAGAAGSDAVAAGAETRTGAMGVRDTIEAWLVQFIPVDAEQRASYTVFAAYHALALTDPALAELPYAANSLALEQALGARLAAAQRAGEVAADREPELEAANLLALATGLGNGVMAGAREPAAAVGLLRYQLDRLFGIDHSGPPSPRPA
ncbi:TetR family transcriptional regulator C-terminal domain-containing protein [Micromonospora costi]|uniref:TetR/AcrR family transcriptional regulator n=1 Tax=Micromonospora costi TaxID=1530042 RepID=UPI00341159A7